MKVLILFSSIALALARNGTSTATSACQQEKVVGPCKAAIDRYFYNKETGKCESFIYGGCRGNSNNFESRENCEAVCVGTSTATSACQQEKVVGPCKAAIDRYFYNKETGKCESFIYGGCRGNSNNFESREDCEAVCVATQQTCIEAPETGICLALIPRWYYDPSTSTCKEFNYGGCGGNGNRYETEEECMQKCYGVTHQSCDAETCELTLKMGSCFGRFPRYYFDKSTGQCEEFIYGGCGGNANNFKTIEECEKACVSAAPSACQEEKKAGLCEAYIERYFFNKGTGRCEMFIYGGCGGNSNNFQSQEKCEAACVA